MEKYFYTPCDIQLGDSSNNYALIKVVSDINDTEDDLEISSDMVLVAQTESQILLYCKASGIDAALFAGGIYADKELNIVGLLPNRTTNNNGKTLLWLKCANRAVQSIWEDDFNATFTKIWN